MSIRSIPFDADEMQGFYTNIRNLFKVHDIPRTELEAWFVLMFDCGWGSKYGRHDRTGTLGCAMDYLAEIFGGPIERVELFLEKLKKAGFIETKFREKGFVRIVILDPEKRGKDGLS